MGKDALRLNVEYGSTNLGSGEHSCKRNEGWMERKDFYAHSESELFYLLLFTRLQASKYHIFTASFHKLHGRRAIKNP